MRHRWGQRKLGRTTSHRLALLRNLVTELLDKESIVTTVPKAKELRPLAEKMITLGKRETLHARRRALATIRKKEVVRKLFETLAPRFSDRNGGYTRIIRLGYRRGDSAEIAMIQLLGSEYQPKTGKKGEKAKQEKKAKTPVKKSSSQKTQKKQTPEKAPGKKRAKEKKSG
ncbi:MAG: 50S ribosomal protein L17 [Acidobacteria bacterium]|nr:50S ribosomal protein L17 [Acidobacteriota bacterium]